MNDWQHDTTTLFWATGGVLGLIFLFLGAGWGDEDERMRMTIDFGDGRVRTFETLPLEDASAWDFLQQVSAQYEIPLEAGRGFSPKTIGERQSGEEGREWVWYKNGQRQQESPIAHELKAGEHVIFRFERQNSFQK